MISFINGFSATMAPICAAILDFIAIGIIVAIKRG